jgi:biopolymer transport protein ExbB/TolQ
MFEILLDLPSAIFVLAPVLFASMSARFTQYGIKLANEIIIQVGLIGTLIGLVVMLTNMSDPNAVGPAMSIALLTILYAVILSAVFSLVSMKLAFGLPDFRGSYSIAAAILWVIFNIWTMTLGAGINAYINIPSIVFIALSISVIAAVSRFNAEDSLLLCAKYLPYVGLIGFFIGIILMLQHLSEPRLIGPAIAISLLTLLYANLMSVAIKLGFPRVNQDNESSRWQYLGFSVLLLALIFSVLIASLR